MKKINFIFVIFLLIIRCDPKKKNNYYYFDFDSIEYYTIEIDINDLLEVKKNPQIKNKEMRKLQFDIVTGSKPENFNDKSFIEDLIEIGFKKKELTTKQYKEIKEIFKEKPYELFAIAACAAIYRDILIFKEKEEIKGIAKICFECGQSQIMGTNKNTEAFGQSGDYSKLAEILNE